MDYSHGKLSGKRLLLVEDDWLLQNLLSTQLTPLISEEVILEPALDGEKAFEFAKAHRPDIILLDLLLPGISGFEFLEKMQGEDATFREVPVIVFSNLNAPEDREKAKQLGVREFMNKSEATIEEIVEKLVSILHAT